MIEKKKKKMMKWNIINEILRIISSKTVNHSKMSNLQYFAKYLIHSDITKKEFARLLEISIQNQSVKRNKVENREYLSLPRLSVQHN